MSAVSNLLARRQHLLKQLEGSPAADQRDEIERKIAQIDTALELLDWLDTGCNPGKPT